MSDGPSTEGGRGVPAANHPDIVLMKFGGTSVQDAAAIQRSISVVKGRRDRGLRPVVVVSAMAKVTDQLLAAAAAAASERLPEALAITQALRLRHLETAAALVGRNIALVARWLDEQFDKLDSILGGIAAVGELTMRTSDLVVSYGERLSSKLVADAFEFRGIRSAHVDARTVILTNGDHGRAVPQIAAIEQALQQHVLPLAEVNAVPILGGFIGATGTGATTTLGRGGSDYTAALIGSGLHAGAIEIWTDVNGIMTADPRICPDALRVKTVSFEEASEMAYFGAKVLHPATILPAVSQNIPVWVLNSHQPENEGTRITAIAPPCASPLKSIASKKRLRIVQIASSRLLMSHGFLRAVFDTFDRHRCAIDMVSTSEVTVSVTVDDSADLDAVRNDLHHIADVEVQSGKALICLVGEDIRGRSGIASRVFAAVKSRNVSMISQGANGINLSFMLDEADVEYAIRALHAEFFASPDPSVFDLTPATSFPGS